VDVKLPCAVIAIVRDIGDPVPVANDLPVRDHCDVWGIWKWPFAHIFVSLFFSDRQGDAGIRRRPGMLGGRSRARAWKTGYGESFVRKSASTRDPEVVEIRGDLVVITLESHRFMV
jgi:hypothetical protein